MSKYLRDVQSIATISGKIAAKLGSDNTSGEFNDISNLIGSEEPQILQVPVESSLKFKLNMKTKKDKKIYSKLDELVETRTNSLKLGDDLYMKTCNRTGDNKEVGKCMKPHNSIERAFEDIPENVCDSIDISFEDLKDGACNELPNDTFNDIPTNTFEDIEVAVEDK